MLSKLKTFVAVAALSGSLGANVYAAMQNGDTQSNLSNVPQTSVGNSAQLITDRIHSVDVHTTVNHQVSVLQMKQVITNLVQPGFNPINKANAVKQNILPALAAGVLSPVVKNTALPAASGLIPAPPTVVQALASAVTAASSPSPASATAEAAPEGTVSCLTPENDESATVGSDPSPAVDATAPVAADTTAVPISTDSVSTDSTAGSATGSAGTDSSVSSATAENATSGTDSSPAPATTEAAPQPAAPAPKESAPAAAPAPKEIIVKATAYTASCEGCSGVTATGINIKDNPNEKVIAVDPKVIPLGSKVYVEGVGYATAADTGGAIKGNRIDVFIPSEKDAMRFGVKHLSVKILN